MESATFVSYCVWSVTVNCYCEQGTSSLVCQESIAGIPISLRLYLWPSLGEWCICPGSLSQDWIKDDLQCGWSNLALLMRWRGRQVEVGGVRVYGLSTSLTRVSAAQWLGLCTQKHHAKASWGEADVQKHPPNHTNPPNPNPYPYPYPPPPRIHTYCLYFCCIVHYSSHSTHKPLAITDCFQHR